jgi:hypothetical protein
MGIMGMKKFAARSAIAWFLLIGCAAAADETKELSTQPSFESPTTTTTPRRRFGGSLSLGVPHPIFLDVETIESPQLTLALGLGGLGIPIKTKNLDDAKLSIGAIDVRARWHPFSGAFFLGGILGVQSLQGSASETIAVSSETVHTTVKVDVGTGYFTPHLGWLWMFKSGLALGTELGLQVPLGTKTKLDIATDHPVANSVLVELKNTEPYRNLESGVSDFGRRIGQIVFPYVTLIRVGWFF